MVYPLFVFGGLVLGLVVRRWWTLAAALGVGLWISITTEVDEVPRWFLGAVYGALVAAGIAAGIVLHRLLRARSWPTLRIRPSTLNSQLAVLG